MKKFTMKHIIMAFTVGALVMLSSQALADTVSQIGNKVDSEAVVIVNGEKVSNAIILKGKSYVPGKDVAEALGGTVKWVGSENAIVITNNFTTDEEIAEYNAKIIEYNKKLAKITASVEGSKREVERLETSLVKAKAEVDTATGVYKDFVSQRIADLEVAIETEKANLAKYEKELADLEANK